MKHCILGFCVIIFFSDLFGQGVPEDLSGQVSFVSSQNIYVRFKSTAGIATGDTLFILSNGALMPVLKVNNLSSTSCVCTKLSDVNPAISDQIIAKNKNAKPENRNVEKNEKEIQPDMDSALLAKKQQNTSELKQKIKGNISAVSYSDFSNTKARNTQRFRYTFSLDARNIANSKFSVESYISFRHKKGDWSEVKNNVFNALKIYSLALKYDLNKSTQISLGRKVNSRISSIGAMDGLQVETAVKNFVLGMLVGSRPDYIDYGFNASLFQFGGYMAHNYKTDNTISETSVAFMQQMNHSKIDRRFLYFQHSNTLIKNLSFFSTFELDLYKLKRDTLNNDHPQNTLNPTGIFLSLRYKVSQKLTLSGTYDARKNVIYYETYKSFIDRILETEIRQGFRLQANYRITRNIMFGLQSGYRFLKSDPHPSQNFYGYLTYNQIPGLNMSGTLSATYLKTSYLNGKIMGVSLSRDLIKGKVQTSLGYRYVDYHNPENLFHISQNVGELNLSWQFYLNISASVNYEVTLEQQNRYNRLYVQIRKRF